ncbi:general secretion pathway protein F [Pseudomonas duriflava]|uniref:General secretion pathway protein F n=1 Tax=Pseudomonas duriflava TaxID=459528 RepID=A0A562QIW6_9PSED|nr:type II secretion system inner membrane protein GspF [Pseudomonas duriflava]TWI56684.1 general secretion pathway protein F [Pseudomonas duriflava]
MAQFRYRALDTAGEAINGQLEAPGQEEAVNQLQERGLLVLQVVPTQGEAARGWRAWFNRDPLSGAGLAQFTQQLATLLSAGQPLDRALSILLSQPSEDKSRRLIERIRERVKGGRPLSAALSEEGGQFSQLYISMVRAGEAGGSLEDTLAQLALYLERSQALRGEVINALIYPAFLVVGVLGSLALLMAYVVPQFVPIFADLGVPVPLMTQSVLWLGQFLSNYGLLILIGLIASLWLLGARLRDPERRMRWDRRLLSVRLMGPLIQRLETARLARTLGTLLGNGVPLLSALSIGRQVCANRALQGAVSEAADQVKDGGSLAAALGSSRLLPHLSLQMIQVGEESGQLDAMLIKVADIFDAEARRGIDRLLAALVPSLTIVMAVLVAFIMLAIMLPLMSLTSNI